MSKRIKKKQHPKTLFFVCKQNRLLKKKLQIATEALENLKRLADSKASYDWANDALEKLNQTLNDIPKSDHTDT